MAEKVNDELYYDERSAGGVVYRTENGNIKWLVVKGAKKYATGQNKWVWKFPKGHLKNNEFLKQAAIREVEEEGKIKAKIITKLASNDYVMWDKLDKKKTIKKVTFFLMEYLEESNLKYFDREQVVEREWLDFEEAQKKLAYDSEKVLLSKAKKKLDEIRKG